MRLGSLCERMASMFKRLIDIVKTKAEHDRRLFLMNDIRSKRISATGRKIEVR